MSGHFLLHGAIYGEKVTYNTKNTGKTRTLSYNMAHLFNLTLKVPITTGRQHFQSMFFIFFRENNA